jgi:hypothetical protein
MAKEKVLIAVKTYPTLSKSHTETACTAGFREDGSWIRLYPIPFRLLDGDKQYEKYQWVEVNTAVNSKDPRPESRKVINIDDITLLNKVETGKRRDWVERRRLILDKNKVYTNKEEIIKKAHADEISLVIFKPAQILDFVVEDADPDWAQDKVDSILNDMKQGDLFAEKSEEDFKLVRKLPYKFSYKFLDDAGKESTLMIEDWEIGQLYWNCEQHYGKDQAVAKVRQKYMDDFAQTKDLHLFLGTTFLHHVRRAKNPFVIIGTFHPPHVTQESLL